MAGRTARQAVQRFQDSLQRSFSCVTRHVLANAGGHYPSETPHGITFAGGLPVDLGGGTDLALVVRLHQYHVKETGEGSESWEVTTAAYYYTLKQSEGPEIISYHWHPFQRSVATFPHLHLQAGARVGRAEWKDAYLPTGRVTAEHFVQLLIEHFGIRPLRKDWQDALQESRAGFEQDATWGRASGAQ